MNENMSFIHSMKSRYTTKMYSNFKKIDSTKIEELKEVLRMSPSSINSQPWKFTFVSDKETKEALANASLFNNEKVLNCDTVVVFSRINKIEVFEKQIAASLPEAAVGYYNNFIKPLPIETIKAWFDKQVYLALGVFLSACAQMQIDSTPMEGIEVTGYDKIIGLEDYTTLVAVAIGYRDDEDFNQPDKNPKSRIELDQVVQSI